jgi:L-phenylalanine/L-methionine N-acetyltransferase
VTEITIRAAEPSDMEAIHAILRCPGVVANTLQLPWRPLEYTRQRFSPNAADSYALVAVVEDRVVGQLGLEVQTGPRRRDVGKFGMAVHDDLQNRGVGSALMAAMLELADGSLGLRRLEMEVWADNPAAIHLYEKFGFVIEGTGRQYGRRAGELIDAHFMARLRASQP